MKVLLLSFAMAAFTLSINPVTHAGEGPVRHVVSFKFKAGTEPAKIRQVEEAFAALKGKIPLIQSLEAGTNSSPEKHDHGFTHIWIATFKDGHDRDAYLVDPAHKEFGAGLKGLIEDVLVLDFVPQ